MNPAPDPGSATEFGRLMTSLLSERQLSLTDLAELVNYDKSTLSRIKTGKRQPSATQAQKVDEALDAGGRLIMLADAIFEPGQPAQLPAQLATFIGRTSALDTLRRVLARPPVTPDDAVPSAPIIAIDGPPGAGKTALAVHFAHQIAAQFPHGQLYVDLRGHSEHAQPVAAADVLEQFLTALAVPASEIPTRTEHRAARYRSTVAGRRILIVLDNAADSDQLELLLPGTTTCAVVITSRERLSGLIMRTGASHLNLSLMTPTESVTLLRSIVGEDRAEAEPDALAALACRCGHLPLALRIAAERVVVQPHNTMADLVEELEDDSALDALDMPDAPAVRAVFSWSYRRLDPQAARMFRVLGLYRCPQISIAAAAALAGVSVPAARRQLDRLAGAHLIQSTRRDFFHFHDLLRDYATELAAETDPDMAAVARARLIAWYLHTVAASHRARAPYRELPLTLPGLPSDVTPLEFHDEPDALAWCDAELGNFVPIIQLAAEIDPIASWQLAVALWNYLFLRQPWGVWIRSHQIALRAATVADDAGGQGWVATNLAEAYRRMGAHDQSEAFYAQARQVREGAGDRHGLGWALAGSAFLAIDQRNPEQAREWAVTALALFAEFGDREGSALLYGTLGDVEHQLGAPDAALHSYREAREVLVSIGSLEGQGVILTKSSRVHAEQGRPEQALADLDGALAAHRAVGDRRGEAATHASIADLLVTMGRTPEARTAWHRALALYEARQEEDEAADVRARLAELGES